MLNQIPQAFSIAELGLVLVISTLQIHVVVIQAFVVPPSILVVWPISYANRIMEDGK
jgi:hypothetical protein